MFPGCIPLGQSAVASCSGSAGTAAAGRAHLTAAPECSSAQQRHRHHVSGRSRPLQHPVGAYMEGHPLLCLGQARTSGGLAYAARQALRRSLPQAHSQRHASLTPLPPCTLLGTACHSQPCYAQLPSLSCGLAVVCSHMGSGQPAGSPPTACRPPASRRQAWSLAACGRLGKSVAETSPPGHHPAAGGILPLSHTPRAAHTASTHCCQGDISGQEPDEEQKEGAAASLINCAAFICACSLEPVSNLTCDVLSGGEG